MRSQWITVVKTLPVDKLMAQTGQQLGRLRSFGPCLACGERNRGSSDTRYACGLNKNMMGWKCFRCGVTGDGVDLLCWSVVGKPSRDCSAEGFERVKSFCVDKGIVSGMDVSKAPPVRSLTQVVKVKVPQPDPTPSPQPKNVPGMNWSDSLMDECRKRLWDTEVGEGVLKYLREGRGFTDESINEFDLGCTIVRGEPWLAIPLKDGSERCVNMRFRSLPPAKKTFRVCSGRPLPLFGADRLKSTVKDPVVVVEGECDVIALWQYGFTSNVVSGTAGASTWKEEWLDELEDYSSFILCYDDDDAGRAGAQNFADKMGADRCSMAVFPRKDAGQCLVENVSRESMHRIVERAQPVHGPEFKRVDAYEGDIERLINNPQELMGRSTGSEKLDKCLGGLRPGLMVVSGDTGHGKTTFATWLLWMQAKEGVPVMVTSFEQRPVGTVQKLLRMQMGGDFTSFSSDERAKSLLELGDLPIHMLDHYGHLSPEDLMQSMKYAYRRLGIKVVLVDHLGFLLDAKSQDKVSQIESVIRNLAITGYSLGITIILVCHPKGTPPGHERITVNDLKGSSAIKQDASEVVIVVRDPPALHANPPRHWPASWVHFDKVRSEFGVPGSKAQMAFGPVSCIYSDSWLDTPEGSKGVFIDDDLL